MVRSRQALIDLYERAVAWKNRWIKMLFTVFCVLLVSMAVIIFYFIWDATHESVGVIRY